MSKIKDLSDHFVAVSRPLIVRGLTRKEKDLATQKDLIKAYGEQFPVFVAEANEAVNTEKKKEQVQEEHRRKQSEIEKALKNTPINMFIRAIQNRGQNPETLRDWNKFTHEELEALHAEFNHLARHRGLPLTEQDIDFASNFLFTLRSKNPNNEKHGLREKLGL